MLPDSFPDRLIPLAWLGGRWQGFGTIVECSIHGDDLALSPKPSYVIFDVSYAVDGDELVESITAFRAAQQSGGAAVSISQPADAGLDALEAGDAWWQEVSRWNVEESRVAHKDKPAWAKVSAVSHGVLTCVHEGEGVPGAVDAPEAAQAPDTASTPDATDAPIADLSLAEGHSALWTGTAQGPRITLSTTVDTHIPVHRIERSYGLVGGELMIVQDIQLASHSASEWCIRMHKISVEA